MPHDRLGLVLDETGVTSHPPRPRHRGRIALLLVIAVVIGGGWFASQFLVESIRTPRCTIRAAGMTESFDPEQTGNAALIAALPRAPGNYSPFEHPDVARRRRAFVLSRMVEHGSVKPEDARRASAAPLGLVAPERRRGTGQYFLEYLQQALEAKLGSDLLYKGGLSVYTTLNPVLQRTAEQALRERS